MPRQRSDYDSPWKEVLERYLAEFIAFFFPHIHAEIDWPRGYEFLDKELQRVVRKAQTGRGYVDKLVKVWRKDGTEEWVLIHIEVQGKKETGFAERMYVYNYRIFDRYKRKVVSLAVLADDDDDWRPQNYGYNLWGCEVNLRFPVVKLLDYEARWAELETSRNPFAVVVMAHLKAQDTYRRPQIRLNWKVALVKGLYARGYSRDDVWELFGLSTGLWHYQRSLNCNSSRQSRGLRRSRPCAMSRILNVARCKRALNKALFRRHAPT